MAMCLLAMKAAHEEAVSDEGSARGIVSPCALAARLPHPPHAAALSPSASLEQLAGANAEVQMLKDELEAVKQRLEETQATANKEAAGAA
jgi:hypothetical protein